MLLRLLLTVVLIYVLVVILAWAFQRHLLYLPNVAGKSVTASPADRGWRYEPVTLTTADGVNISGWWLPLANARATLLFFHGNAGNIGHRLDSLALFRALHLSVLIIDYHGYGDSEGNPSETGTRMDSRAAWHHLIVERGIPAEQIIVFGRSLGAAVAAELAREHAPGAVILESPFRSLADMAQSAYPFLPARWLVRYEYATEAYVRDIDAPVLVIHSENDDIIPYSHGQAVFAAAREPKSMLVIGGDHNTGFLSDTKKYLGELHRFLYEAGFELKQ
ncbi:MAG TPA: alpha/beta hydrolase [Gammaproteobacteria bacterium]